MLESMLTCTPGESEIPVQDTEISFFSGEGDKILLGKSITDSTGVARYTLPEDFRPAANGENKWTFSAVYDGNDTIQGGEADVAVRDISLKMALSEVDSIKTVTVTAFITENGKEIPASGESVTITVPRMFSLLNIGDLTFDDSGSASVEFPNDIPGDKEGKLTVLARLADNTTYGNVERSENLKWGIPVDYSVPVSHRALWTQIAPKWMVYTLSILLAGVWGHYLYAVISLIRIKLEARRNEIKDEFGV
jgi:hypothetical protein